MKPRRPVAREHVMFVAVLVLLSILVVILWLKDPAHRYNGKSRVDWPPPAQSKP
jgi:hypothetical protein